MIKQIFTTGLFSTVTILYASPIRVFIRRNRNLRSLLLVVIEVTALGIVLWCTIWDLEGNSIRELRNRSLLLSSYNTATYMIGRLAGIKFKKKSLIRWIIQLGSNRLKPRERFDNVSVNKYAFPSSFFCLFDLLYQ
jgi:hypothetical protein